jgi:hypothetical protein
VCEGVWLGLEAPIKVQAREGGGVGVAGPEAMECVRRCGCGM